MRSPQLILLFLCLFCNLQAQKITLKGSIQDTLDQPLTGATVMLLQAKDSVLTAFGISNPKGEFALEKISPDDYILQITYLGYANVSQPIFLTNQMEDKDLGVFVLEPENTLLTQVEVKAEHIPIQFRKDTIEYNAAAFATKPNAAVEDLLKKLPGVEVDRNGAIKAQGETVQKVLVDGKEFFGNDPKIATKNLPADAVEKVQVFDKKSEIAEFSGIDDGRDAKTINLSLKEDKKKGYFGRVTGGYGTDDRYENKFNVNRFGSEIQLSALGMFNNTNQQGFSINDYINMMGGLNNLLAGGGGQLTLDSDDLGLPLDAGQKNQGFTTTFAGGINLNWKLNNKTELHTSYFYNGIQKDFDLTETQEYVLGDKKYQSNRNAMTDRKNYGHRLNINLTTKIDSFQTLKWRSNLGFTQKNTTQNSIIETYNLEAALENRGSRNLKSAGDDFRWNNNLTYLRRFKKKGRFFTLRGAFETRKEQNQTQLEALNNFFLPKPTLDSISQDHFRDNERTNYGGEVTYTEPLGKAKYLEINYSYKNYGQQVEKEVYDKIEDRSVFNETLSNNFRSDYLYHRAGLNYKWKVKKLNLNAGVQTQNAILKGQMILSPVNLQKDFFNVLPKLFMTYDFKATRSLRFDYRTRIQEPYIEQLQPIVDNSDPLNIYVGNPDLIPEYLHDLRLHFNSFDQFSSISIFANLEATITENKILDSRTIDNQFRQTIRPINFGKDARFSTYLSFGAPLKFIASRIKIISDVDWYKGNYFINGNADKFNSQRMRYDVSINNRNTEVLDIAVGYKWTKNKINYTGESQQNQTYSEQIMYADFAVNFSDAWTISTTMDYNRYSNASFAEADDIALWQAAIEYNFLKNKRATLKLAAHDLLNQNLGINRQNQLNFVQEQRIRSLGRYFLLSFSYALSGFGGNDSGIEVIKHR